MTVGTGVTVTVVDLLTGAPPGAEHETVYVVVVGGLTVVVPVSAMPIVLPPGPHVPVQAVAFVEVQLTTELWPTAIDNGTAVTATVGVGAGVTVIVDDLLLDVPPTAKHETV